MNGPLTAVDVVLLVLLANVLTLLALLAAVALTYTIHQLVGLLADSHERWKERRARRLDLQTCRAISNLGTTDRPEGSTR
ncbi:hypothetical protein [Streptomyces omiyaensis]|uniref:hypothetical protein n=1 Tax=Streptomyces omiyaensis TaxID=68247 RepID=UPI0037009E9E